MVEMTRDSFDRTGHSFETTGSGWMWRSCWRRQARAGLARRVAARRSLAHVLFVASTAARRLDYREFAPALTYTHFGEAVPSNNALKARSDAQ